MSQLHEAEPTQPENQELTLALAEVPGNPEIPTVPTLSRDASVASQNSETQASQDIQPTQEIILASDTPAELTMELPSEPVQPEQITPDPAYQEPQVPESWPVETTVEPAVEEVVDTPVDVQESTAELSQISAAEAMREQHNNREEADKTSEALQLTPEANPLESPSITNATNLVQRLAKLSIADKAAFAERPGQTVAVSTTYLIDTLDPQTENSVARDVAIQDSVTQMVGVSLGALAEKHYKLPKVKTNGSLLGDYMQATGQAAAVLEAVTKRGKTTKSGRAVIAGQFREILGQEAMRNGKPLNDRQVIHIGVEKSKKELALTNNNSLTSDNSKLILQEGEAYLAEVAIRPTILTEVQKTVSKLLTATSEARARLEHNQTHDNPFAAMGKGVDITPSLDGFHTADRDLALKRENIRKAATAINTYYGPNATIVIPANSDSQTADYIAQTELVIAYLKEITNKPRGEKMREVARALSVDTKHVDSHHVAAEIRHKLTPVILDLKMTQGNVAKLRTAEVVARAFRDTKYDDAMPSGASREIAQRLLQNDMVYIGNYQTKNPMTYTVNEAEIAAIQPGIRALDTAALLVLNPEARKMVDDAHAKGATIAIKPGKKEQINISIDGTDFAFKAPRITTQPDQKLKHTARKIAVATAKWVRDAEISAAKEAKDQQNAAHAERRTQRQGARRRTKAPEPESQGPFQIPLGPEFQPAVSATPVPETNPIQEV